MPDFIDKTIRDLNNIRNSLRTAADYPALPGADPVANPRVMEILSSINTGLTQHLNDITNNYYLNRHWNSSEVLHNASVYQAVYNTFIDNVRDLIIGRRNNTISDTEFQELLKNLVVELESFRDSLKTSIENVGKPPKIYIYKHIILNLISNWHFSFLLYYV